MSTENLFKPSNRKDCRGVVLANILESVGIPLDRSETYSHRVFNPLGRKIRNLGSLYALIHEETRKPEENPSREAKKVPAKSKDVGKIILRAYPSRTMAYTTHNTVNRLTHNELHLNPVVLERSKEK